MPQIIFLLNVDDSFTKLPLELLTAIFKLLETKSDLDSVARTCKTFNNVIKNPCFQELKVREVYPKAYLFFKKTPATAADYWNKKWKLLEEAKHTLEALNTYQKTLLVNCNAVQNQSPHSFFRPATSASETLEDIAAIKTYLLTPNEKLHLSLPIDASPLGKLVNKMTRLGLLNPHFKDQEFPDVIDNVLAEKAPQQEKTIFKSPRVS